MQSWASGVLGSVSVDLAYACAAQSTHIVFRAEVTTVESCDVTQWALPDKAQGCFLFDFELIFWSLNVQKCFPVVRCSQHPYSGQVVSCSVATILAHHSRLHAEQTDKQKANCQNWLPATMSKNIWSRLVKPTSIWMGYALMHLCSDISFVF